MEPFQWAMVAIAILGVLFTTGGVIAAVTYKISGLETKITKMLADEREVTGTKYISIRKDFADEVDAVRREVGEMGNALRTKIHEVETWSRDNFARRGSLGEMRIDMNQQFQSLTKAIEKRFDKIEDKIDRKGPSSPAP